MKGARRRRSGGVAGRALRFSRSEFDFLRYPVNRRIMSVQPRVSEDGRGGTIQRGQEELDMVLGPAGQVDKKICILNYKAGRRSGTIE